MPASSSPLALNLRTLQIGGPAGWVDVSDADCSLLLAFTESDLRRVDTAHILEKIGITATELGKRALNVRMVRLRKKLEQAGAAAPIIKSIRGKGYQLCVEIGVTHA